MGLDWSCNNVNTVWDAQFNNPAPFEPNTVAFDKNMFDASPYDCKFYTDNFTIKHVAHKFVVPCEQYQLKFGLPKPFEKSTYDIGFRSLANTSVAEWNPMNQFVAYKGYPFYFLRQRGAMTHDETVTGDNRPSAPMFGSHCLSWILKINMFYDVIRNQPWDTYARVSTSNNTDLPTCLLTNESQRDTGSTAQEAILNT